MYSVSGCVSKLWEDNVLLQSVAAQPGGICLICDNLDFGDKICTKSLFQFQSGFNCLQKALYPKRQLCPQCILSNYTNTVIVYQLH